MFENSIKSDATRKLYNYALRKFVEYYKLRSVESILDIPDKKLPEMLDGKENTPLIITRDDVVLDGHGRLCAYLSLNKSLKALILPYAFDQLKKDASFGLLYGSSFDRYMHTKP